MSDVQAQFIKFKKYKELLKQLVSRDLKVKYRRSVLGYLWSLLNPLLMMVVISAVFSYMFRFDIEYYPVYLLSGQIFFQFFSDATNMAMGSIIIGVLIMRVKITAAILLTPIPLLFILCFTMGIGMIMSVLSVYFRDVVHLYSVLLTAWMYVTPIFYPLNAVPENIQVILKCNPLYQIITCFRTILLDGQIPTLENLFICIIWCAISIVGGLWLFKKKQCDFILHI